MVVFKHTSNLALSREIGQGKVPRKDELDMRQMKTKVVDVTGWAEGNNDNHLQRLQAAISGGWQVLNTSISATQEPVANGHKVKIWGHAVL